MEMEAVAGLQSHTRRVHSMAAAGQGLGDALTMHVSAGFRCHATSAAVAFAHQRTERTPVGGR